VISAGGNGAAGRQCAKTCLPYGGHGKQGGKGLQHHLFLELSWERARRKQPHIIFSTYSKKYFIFFQSTNFQNEATVQI
jgi:hypothetical protein